MKTKVFILSVICLSLLSCNNNEVLENELDTMSYLEGIWERVDYSIVTLKNGKERVDNSTLYGYIGPKYFLFEKDVLVCYSYAPDMILESHYFFQEYMYKYNTQTQTITLVNDRANVIDGDGRRWRTKEPAVCYFYKDYWFNFSHNLHIKHPPDIHFILS